MFSSRNNIPVQCQVCGFPFAVLVGEGVRLVWCPSCGMEFTCTSVAMDSGDNTSASITASDKFSAEAERVGSVGVSVDGAIDGNIVAGTIGTESNCTAGNDSEFAQNISINHEDGDCDSFINSGKCSSAVKRWRILFASVSVQVIALLMLPMMIFSTTSNVDLGVEGSGVIESGGTIAINEITTPNHIPLTTTTIPTIQKIPTIQNIQNDKNSAEEKQTSTQRNEVDEKISSFATADSVVRKQDEVEAVNVADNHVDKPNDAKVEVVEDNGNFMTFLDTPPLQPSTRSTKKNELPNVTNSGNDRKSVGLERVIQVGSDYETRFIETGLNGFEFESNNVMKLPDGASTNLPSNEHGEDNKSGENTEESAGDVYVEVDEDVGLLSYEIQLNRAREQLFDGGKLSAISPERGLKTVIQAINRYQELGQAVPFEAKWILGRAYVTQRWGEALVENIPGLADMAISSDGQWLWCRCEDNTIWIWDILRSRKTLGGFKLESGKLGIVKLVFTPDFRFAVGVGVDGLVRVWNMELPESGRSMVVLGGKVSNPVDLQISPDG
ncbi:MAG: hypothetical protein LBK06_08955, partial [Planctomycetaceae bacterium]|nr:hypothetical protein [Planctomycetaceae bacterium]